MLNFEQKIDNHSAEGIFLNQLLVHILQNNVANLPKDNSEVANEDYEDINTTCRFLELNNAMNETLNLMKEGIHIFKKKQNMALDLLSMYHKNNLIENYKEIHNKIINTKNYYTMVAIINTLTLCSLGNKITNSDINNRIKLYDEMDNFNKSNKIIVNLKDDQIYTSNNVNNKIHSTNKKMNKKKVIEV